MGMQRYSEPRCEKLGRVGSPCRPGQEPENRTLHYPFGIMQCEDVYLQSCPCANGLVCEDGACTRDLSQKVHSTGSDDRGNEYEEDDHQFELLAVEPSKQNKEFPVAK